MTVSAEGTYTAVSRTVDQTYVSSFPSSYFYYTLWISVVPINILSTYTAKIFPPLVCH